MGMRFALLGREKGEEGGQRVEREGLSGRQRQVFPAQFEPVAQPVIADHRQAFGLLHLDPKIEKAELRLRSSPSFGSLHRHST